MTATAQTDDPTVSLDAAASLAGITRSHLWALVERGEIETTQVRGPTRICLSTVGSLKTQLADDSAELRERLAELPELPELTEETTTVTADVRPGWDTYFLGMAKATSARADCHRRKVGAVLVDEARRVISAGYNGAPSGVLGCLSGGCPRGKLTYEQVAGLSDYDSGAGRCVALHAEVNAVLYAARSTRGATMYINHEPCGPCLRTMAGAGIARAVWPEGECDPVAEHVNRTGTGAPQ
ncbi:deoxycytidylate deaminase [Ornithinimicrobium murale]|uniref:deoxycytidylate deaminase n=1 Tax=Ornithinimicrobium murale TaxID=1050153 RepID=UPI000E0D6CFC|nr:deaminase [Ornithinimicrobium murale]